MTTKGAKWLQKYTWIKSIAEPGHMWTVQKGNNYDRSEAVLLVCSK